MFGLKMTKDSVSAWCSKLTESAGEQFSLWVFYDVGIDQVFSRSCGICKRFLVEERYVTVT